MLFGFDYQEERLLFQFLSAFNKLYQLCMQCSLQHLSSIHFFCIRYIFHCYYIWTLNIKIELAFPCQYSPSDNFLQFSPLRVLSVKFWKIPKKVFEWRCISSQLLLRLRDRKTELYLFSSIRVELNVKTRASFVSKTPCEWVVLLRIRRCTIGSSLRVGGQPNPNPTLRVGIFGRSEKQKNREVMRDRLRRLKVNKVHPPHALFYM